MVDDQDFIFGRHHASNVLEPRNDSIYELPVRKDDDQRIPAEAWGPHAPSHELEGLLNTYQDVLLINKRPIEYTRIFVYCTHSTVFWICFKIKIT